MQTINKSFVKQMLKIDVILPTVDENRNLEILVPELLRLRHVRINQIMIVDDSEEKVQKELTQLSRCWPKSVKLVLRTGCTNSLASAIRCGVESSVSSYVVWMDADLSMPASIIETLASQVKNLKSVVIGSRFVEGGGFKGISEGSGYFSPGWILRVMKSQDSVLGVLLSRLLNLVIRLVVGGNVRDLTSGYILCSREIALRLLPHRGYGEYCIEFLSRAHNEELEITEVGYYCAPREFGYSKTGNNLLELFKTGLPYLEIALKNSRMRNRFRLTLGKDKHEE